jgi:hypothetical protein
MTVLSAAAIVLEGIEDDNALAYKMRWFIVATGIALYLAVSRLAFLL